MKTLLALVSLLSMQLSFSLEVDTQKSKLIWTGKKVTGEHTGEIKIKSANLKEKNGKLTDGEITVNMKTISVTDLSGDYAKKLKNHLESDDFFSVSQYPQAVFKLNDVTYTSNNMLKAKGELSIKGTTHSTKKPVVKLKGFKHVGNKITGKLVFDRTAYNIRYGSGKFFENLGDKMIYDDVEVDINLVLK